MLVEGPEGLSSNGGAMRPREIDKHKHDDVFDDSLMSNNDNSTNHALKGLMSDAKETVKKVQYSSTGWEGQVEGGGKL